MPLYFFTWTSEILEHLAEHDVTPEEFEEIVNDPEYENVSRTTGSPLAMGYTGDGRRLCRIFRRLDDDTIEPTAYEVSD